MHHAVDVAVGSHEHAQVAGAAGGVLHITHRGVWRNHREATATAHQRAHGVLLHLERTRYLGRVAHVQCPHVHRMLHQVAQAVGVLPGQHRVHGVHPHARQHPVGRLVEGPQWQPGDAQEAAHGERQQDGRLLGVGNGPRLGRHLADDQVQERDDEQRQGEGHHVGGDLREPGGAQGGHEPVVHRGLGERTQAKRAQRDAQLGAGQQQGELRCIAQRRPCRAAVLSGLLQAVALGPDERELHGHEEGAQGDERDGGQHDAHGGPGHERPSAVTRTSAGT